MYKTEASARLHSPQYIEKFSLSYITLTQ